MRTYDSSDLFTLHGPRYALCNDLISYETVNKYHYKYSLITSWRKLDIKYFQFYNLQPLI